MSTLQGLGIDSSSVIAAILRGPKVVAEAGGNRLRPVAAPLAWREVRAEKSPYRWMRAVPPCAKARTCSTVAIVVSPGNVVSSAPCAQPRRTAFSGDSPLSRP